MCGKISAVILTYNEEKEIVDLLQHLRWCDEIIIVDSHSEDATRKIARDHGAIVINTDKPAPGEAFDQLRQHGVNAASHDWILSIDADERLPNKLQYAIDQHIQRDDAEEILEAPRANYLGGQMLRGAGQWPDYEPIAFRKGAIKFTPVPHGFAEYQTENIRKLPVDEELAVEHDFADSVYEHWLSQRRYAKIGGNHRTFKFRHLLSPLYGFFERFIQGKGYLDGIAGFGISLCWAWYQAETTLRSAVKELRYRSESDY